MSTSQLPPLALCSSTDVWPPEKACLLILFFTCLGVSVKNMDELSSLALIFVWAPCRNKISMECNTLHDRATSWTNAPKIVY